ncbi:MAG: hypothetical protein JNM94_16040 [Phycisphaerae bacterium]|nr:hypothetical protein [Phycisphaerae bacterium]
MRADSIPAWVPLAGATLVAVLGTTFLIRPALVEADRLDQRSDALEREAAQRPIVEAALAAAIARRDLISAELAASADGRTAQEIDALVASLALDVAADGDTTTLSGAVPSRAVSEVLRTLDGLPRRSVASATFESQGDGAVRVHVVLRLPSTDAWRDRMAAGDAE